MSAAFAIESAPAEASNAVATAIVAADFMVDLLAGGTPPHGTFSGILISALSPASPGSPPATTKTNVEPERWSMAPSPEGVTHRLHGRHAGTEIGAWGHCLAAIVHCSKNAINENKNRLANCGQRRINFA
jgi:hypothetical protein